MLQMYTNTRVYAKRLYFIACALLDGIYCYITIFLWPLFIPLLQAEEGEEDDEINKLLKGGKKKKKKNEKTHAELALIVEQCIAELEVTAEADAELNRQSKPAINKLKKLPMLIDVLSK